MIERPYLNDYCDKCKHCWYIEKDEARCRKHKLGMSDGMCVQIVRCDCFAQDISKPSHRPQ